MTTRMLIDAAHPEETRVVVVKGNRLEEFDFESSAKKQIKGNIYLARVTRIEPSLQAAFVEYGGNRHGFLAFNEIHPDYYQIPVADREALLAEEAEAVSIEDEPEDEDALEDALDDNLDHHASEDASTADDAETKGNEVDLAEEEPAEDGEAETNETPDPQPIEAEAIESSEEDAPTSEADAEGIAEDQSDDPDKGSIALSAGPIDSTRMEVDDTESGDSEDGSGEFPTAEEPTESVDAVDTAPDQEENIQDEVVAEPSEVSSEADAQRQADPEDDAQSAEDTQAAQDVDPEDVPDVDDNQKDEIGVTDIDDDTADIRRRRRTRTRRNYRIQEVIKKRQVLLVQVVKEERGNKGAALTTYLSLAGRYCVLMPNTARGGGISRKITNQATRRKLKSTLGDLDVPKGMGVIVRTAGSERTKSEIKRDFDYLFRVWDNVRDLTLSSQAPTIVYEEANLIKRAIRDLYAKQIDEVLVEGEEGYRLAKNFMRMLMPSHAKRVQPYRDQVPLFHRYQVHQQLDSMHSSVVTLKSGGYMVLNPTEALVAVDVNSGKSTRGRNIEETALKTNLEAAEELARQLRLRDLAGLVVVDFIDMDEHRNNRAVERRFKECVKSDRARTQVGRISNFGLLEMSRQRLRPSLQEAISITCPHCEGSGYMRSIESSVLHVLRAIEEEGIRGRAAIVRAYVSPEVALHTLNFKRQTLAEIEERYQITVVILADDKLISPAYRIEQEGQRENVAVETLEPIGPVEDIEERGEGSGRKRRRRRRGKKDDREVQTSETAPETTETVSDGENGDDENKPKRRRRGRRGGRNRKNGKGRDATTETTSDTEEAQVNSPALDEAAPAQSDVVDAVETADAEAKPAKSKRKRTTRKKSARKATADVSETSVNEESTNIAEGNDEVANEAAAEVEQTPKPKSKAVNEATDDASQAKVADTDESSSSAEPELDPNKPKRKGWWQRAIGR